MIPFMMTAERLLYIDESYYDSSAATRFYTMTGALIDYSQRGSYSEMMRQLEDLARRQPANRHGYRSLHATTMESHPEGRQDLETAQKIIAQCEAVHLMVTVRTYLTNVRSSEDARQICLTELVTRFQAQGRLDGITMDTRDNLGTTAKSAKAQAGSKNARDLRTLHDLQKVEELDQNMKIFHARDESVRQLWIPDIAGYVVGRSIARQDAAYMRILAGKIEIYEAVRLPPSMRDSGVP